MLRRIVIVSLATALVALAGCSSGDGRELPPPGPDQTASIAPQDTAAPGSELIDASASTTAALDTTPATEATTTTVLTTESSAAAGSAATTPAHDEEGLQFHLTAPWTEAAEIPVEYTCDGAGTSPALSWSDVPTGTVSLAVVMTDLDADGFVHWVAFGIDPALGSLPAGQLPEGVGQATNSFGDVGYGGPCPPSGNHAYLLELYAVSQQLELADGVPAADAIAAAQAAALATASVLGVYGEG